MKYSIIKSSSVGAIGSSWNDAQTTLNLARQWVDDGVNISIQDQNGRKWSFDDFEEFVTSGDADQ